MWFFKQLKLDDVVPHLDVRERRRRTRVVLVDDEPDNFPSEYLTTVGFNIHHFKEIDAEKMNRLQSGEFDIVILDIAGVAPKEQDDGLSILHSLKKVRPTQVVVAFSGQTFDLSKQPFFDKADDCLFKPVTAGKAEELLDNLISSKLTPQARWHVTLEHLRTNGIDDSTLRKVEHLLATSVKQKTSIQVTDVRSLVKDAKLVGEVSVLLTKIVEFSLA